VHLVVCRAASDPSDLGWGTCKKSGPTLFLVVTAHKALPDADSTVSRHDIDLGGRCGRSGRWPHVPWTSPWRTGTCHAEPSSDSAPALTYSRLLPSPESAGQARQGRWRPVPRRGGCRTLKQCRLCDRHPRVRAIGPQAAVSSCTKAVSRAKSKAPHGP